MATYESYKDSGVKWLGQIPSHWEVKKLRAFFTEVSEVNSATEITNQLQFKYGTIVSKPDTVVDNDVLNTISKYTIVRPGDIVINGLNLNYDLLSFRVGKVNELGVITSAYISMRPNSNLSAKFYEYLLKAMDAKKVFHGFGTGIRATLSFKELKHKPIPLVPLAEQEAIVAYLDKVTAEIDRAIEAQRKLIEALNERKQIIISRAVTRGVNPDAPLRDSGIDWLGQIPTHWDIRKLKWIISTPLQYGANESPVDFSESLPRYIRITDISSEGSLKSDGAVSLSWSKAQKYILNKGDILFARSGATVGKSYLFNDDIIACFAGYLIKAKCNNLILPEFLMFYTQSIAYENWKNFIFNKATIQNIGADKYSILLIPFPSIEEQESILTKLQSDLAPLRQASVACERMISLLQERKQIIINEVVTGKKKVI